MREMWELPGLNLKQKAARSGLVIALVWALAAVPLVAWLVLRDPVLPPPPPERELSVMELAAVADARSSSATASFMSRAKSPPRWPASK